MTDMSTESIPATMSIPDACKVVGVSKNYGFRLAAEGKFPGARRIGNRWVVSRKALMAFLDGTTGQNDAGDR
jgi:excisionase family DNA binding protein